MYTADANETFFIFDRCLDKWHKYIGIENLIKGMIRIIDDDLDSIYNNIDFTGCDKTIGYKTITNVYTRTVNRDDPSLRLIYPNISFHESEKEPYVDMPLYYHFDNGTVISFTNETITLRFRETTREYDRIPTQPKRYMILRDNHDGKTCSLLNVRGYEKMLKTELAAYKKSMDAIARRRRETRHIDKKKIYTGATYGERLKKPHFRGNHTFFFRCGPVPGINNDTYHWDTPNKQYKYCLVNADDIRPKARVYAPYKHYRQDGHSWKNSYKCRHQYEKHLIRRNKAQNTYIDSFYDDEPELDMYQLLEEDFEKQLSSDQN